MENNITNEIKKITSRDDLSQEEKTRLIQNIMTNKFLNSNTSNNTNNNTNDINNIYNIDNIKLNVDDKYNFKKYPDNLNYIKKQYFKIKEIDEKNCEHYNRRCYIVSDCCLKVYNCRLCHDDDEEHEINRHNTEYIICKNCDLIQRVNEYCNGCNIKFSEYFCRKCVLYMENTEAYHCEKCNFCRVGEKINYIHCDICNMCFHKDYYKIHKCSDNYQGNCSICFENIYHSRNKAAPLPCGHVYHLKCIQEHFINDYKCPLCKKSAGNMEDKWREIDTVCGLNPTPDEYKNWKLKVYCNDCEQQTITPFNLLYIKCQNCNGYNTQNVDIYKNLPETEIETETETGTETEIEIEIETESDLSLISELNSSNSSLTSLDLESISSDDES